MIDQLENSPAHIQIRTEPVQRRSAERVTLLLDTAAALIDEKGIDGLTTSEVAARSQSSVGVVYRYYPNIQSLLRALASRSMERFIDRVFPSTPAADDANQVSVLDTVIDTWIDFARTEPGFRAVGFGDVIDRRFIGDHAGANSVVAGIVARTLAADLDREPDNTFAFDIEIAVEVIASLLARAFRNNRNGDERFIAKARAVATGIVAPHVNASA